MECWQQRPHWGLTSAAGLEDVSPRALGHRQSREYLRGDKADFQTPGQRSHRELVDSTIPTRNDAGDYFKGIKQESNMTKEVTASPEDERGKMF